METYVTFAASGYALGQLQLFEGVDDALAARLLGDCLVARLLPGERLPDSSEHGARLYVVLRGALDAGEANGARGGLPSVATRILPGECAGELSVLDQEASSESLMAAQECDLLIIPADTLWKLIDESNHVARNLLRLLSFRIRAANAQLRRRQKLGEFYRQLSLVDGLTGLQNRAWLDHQLPAMVEQARDSDAGLALIMIDIDHFKRFNDEHGHQLGDHALKTVSQAVRAALRPTDFAARYGGEELIVLLPGTSHAGCAMVAERLCEHIRETTVFADPARALPHVTASVGYAALQAHDDAQTLVARADAALYRAKQAGRDQAIG